MAFKKSIIIVSLFRSVFFGLIKGSLFMPHDFYNNIPVGNDFVLPNGSKKTKRVICLLIAPNKVTHETDIQYTLG